MRFVLVSFVVAVFSSFAAVMVASDANGGAVGFAFVAAVSLAFVKSGSFTAYKRRVALLGASALLVLGALPLHFTRLDVPELFALPVAFTLVGIPFYYLIWRRIWGGAAKVWLETVDIFEGISEKIDQNLENISRLAAAVGLEPTAEDLAAEQKMKQGQAAMMAELTQPMRVYDRVLSAIRAIGPAVLALGFLLFWVAAYAVLWFLDPTQCSGTACTGAFLGLGAEPLFGDFVYMAVSGLVGNTPAGIMPATAVAKMSFAAQFLSAAVLLGAYATAVFSRVPEASLSGS